LQKAKEKLMRERETNVRENRYWLGIISNTWYNSNGDFSGFNDYDKIVNSFTIDDIKEATKKWCDFNNFYSVALKPENSK